MITGNKGEWSELYVLLKLLANGKLYAADENIHKIDDIYFPILKVLRNESENKHMIYNLGEESTVALYINDSFIGKYPRESLDAGASIIFRGIVNGGESSFSIEGAEEIMSDIGCTKLKAPSSDKTDITMQLLDVNTGYNPICGFSIKSNLGHPPTLLNAGATTNFIYEIFGINDDDMRLINSYNDRRSKIRDRIQAIKDKGAIRFVKTESSTFANNLMLIDSVMDVILGAAVLHHYLEGTACCKDVVSALEEANPLGYPVRGFYEYKFKKFLCSVALGMMPGTPWNGRDEANGGYIVVTTDGEVLAYHIYNRDFFEQYLLNNTKFERASTTRHKYAVVYREADKYYIKFNLQIRFSR